MARSSWHPSAKAAAARSRTSATSAMLCARSRVVRFIGPEDDAVRRVEWWFDRPTSEMTFAIGVPLKHLPGISQMSVDLDGRAPARLSWRRIGHRTYSRVKGKPLMRVWTGPAPDGTICATYRAARGMLAAIGLGRPIPEGAVTYTIRM